MTKPLELTIFEKEPGRYGREPLYNSPDGFWAYPASHVDGYAANKHLTDAELAAEVWHFDYEDFGGESRPDDPDEVSDEAWNEYIQRRMDAEQALKRFATLPHADESGYE